ncbi:kynurenine formamidase isoform X1 [Opisthocomus hoazin]|uniref:kynurenine formamidase isoform X1 n=1 Tax=Opisthocomus hoazin TaxID=30419 RepID=UPI003F52AEBB
MEGWRGMSAEALERQYSPSRWSPRLGSDAVLRAHLAATAAGTQRARAGARTSLHVPYGTGPGEQLDIYLPAEPSGPFSVLVYIHGGYWQCLSKDESGFAAPPLVSRGVGVVAVGYDTAPHGHMDAMVRQVRRSIAFLAERYSGARWAALGSRGPPRPAAMAAGIPARAQLPPGAVWGAGVAVAAAGGGDELRAVAEVSMPRLWPCSLVAVRGVGWQAGRCERADPSRLRRWRPCWLLRAGQGVPGQQAPRRHALRCLTAHSLQGPLPVRALGRGPPGSHGVVHGLGRVRSGAGHQRSCAGERHLRPRAHPAHLRERCAEHEPGGRPEEQPHAVHPPRSACGQRGACGCGPARLPGVSPAVAGVRPGAACRRLGRLPARPRWRGSL